MWAPTKVSQSIVHYYSLILTPYVTFELSGLLNFLLIATDLLKVVLNEV